MQESLFKIQQIARETTSSRAQTKSKSVKTEEKSEAKIGKASEKVKEVIGEIKMGETIHYASIGEWSTHDLLFHILDQTGPAEIIFSTWSVSEDAIRQLIQKVKEGTITKISGVLDWRVKMRRPEAFELANFNIANLRLTTCHAKVTVIENDAWSIVIVGSANYTNNPRIEAGVISCDKKAADFHKKWMSEALEEADPFDTKKTRKNR